MRVHPYDNMRAMAVHDRLHNLLLQRQFVLVVDAPSGPAKDAQLDTVTKIDEELQAIFDFIN